MTQEEKQLLLKDLCARLLYGVKVKVINSDQDERIVTLNYGNVCHVFGLEKGRWTECKPYLRPMSSMTEEEEKEFQEIKLSYHFDEDGYILFDWLNAHHFDYHGLIEKGLALEAKDGMYEENK